MSQNDENDQPDPAASTQHFQRFVQQNPEPEQASRPSLTPYILAGVVALAVLALIVAIVMMWN